jgi:hypothetical protein
VTEEKPMTGETIRLHERMPDEREALDYIEWSAAAQVSKGRARDDLLDEPEGRLLGQRAP